VSEEGLSAYSKRELAQLAKAFSLMGDDAVEEARKLSGSLADYALKEIRQAGYKRTKSAGAVRAVVNGATISKSSKTGRIQMGFARQRLSGGASTQQLWGGLEFGAPGSKYQQFPRWSGRYGKGSRGWFIYPTLREIQPELTEKWVSAADDIVKRWAN
jgi:hypothetical protein